jgi:hypothetical protein
MVGDLWVGVMAYGLAGEVIRGIGFDPEGEMSDKLLLFFTAITCLAFCFAFWPLTFII